MASALGGAGVTIRSPGDLEALPDRIDGRDRDRPLLIDVRLDPDFMTMW